MRFRPIAMAACAAAMGMMLCCADTSWAAHDSPAPEARGNDITTIISLVIEAYGGHEAIMRAGEHFARGRIRDEASGVYKTYAHYIAARTRLRVDTSHENRSEVFILNGRRGSVSRFNLLPERLEGIELLRLRFWYLCISMPRILAAEQYTAMDLKAVSGPDGGAYVFRVMLQGMPDATVEVDASTGLIRKVEAVLTDGDAGVLAGMRMSAYTEGAGSFLPMKMTRIEDGKAVADIEVMAYDSGLLMSSRLFE